MKKIYFIVLISVMLMTLSCQKEDDHSAGELVSNELQSVIKENKIDRVINFDLSRSWENTLIYGDYGINYKFQGQFVFIDGEGYNLNNLIKYQIAERTSVNGSVKYLLLSFY